MMNFLELTIGEFLSFKEGREVAFRTIFNQCQPIIFRKASQFCSSIEEAEEITQEAFIQLFLKRNDILEIAAIYPFLHTVAKRLAITNFRRRLVNLRFEQELVHHWSESSENTQQELCIRELNNLWTAVIEELPPQQQLIYRMNKLEDQSYDEIAAHSGLSKTTVRNHLYLANKYVRLRMEKIILILFFIIF
ncbi:RNA polymerase sigma factor [Sphingobacterium sp. SG20118]|uniref:RNA polymerase sigma factor n=1 Tax=Sphingobacterium sp. SG20118 TaxID=3367156 RepID=UPI0037DFC046